jgi:hypothetical protein
LGWSEKGNKNDVNFSLSSKKEGFKIQRRGTFAESLFNKKGAKENPAAAGRFFRGRLLVNINVSVIKLNCKPM